MDKQFAAALCNADEESLTAIANKGIYKRAVKDSENAEAEITEHDTSAEVTFSDVKCVITVPLENSSCTCPSRTICRHIITAILLLKKQLPDEDVTDEEIVPHETEMPEKAPEKQESISEKADEKPEKSRSGLTKNDIEKIHSSAGMCMGLICGVLTHGLVRIPETAAEDFELAAVRCHGTEMAECERLMRGLGGRLADHASRRASFDIVSFTDRLLRTAEHLESIMKDEITSDDLGSFRNVYENVEGRLELLPIGQRTIAGGEYEGEVYYFLNNDIDAKQRFLTFSDIRPTFYETAVKRRMAACPWGLEVPLSSMMKQRMTLVGAKVCDGKLSASKDTIVAAYSPAMLNCSLVHSLMVTDFREIVLRLGESASERETDKLFFIYPKRMVRYGFDKNEQRLDITFEDQNGRIADCSVKYRSESKNFIEQLETICKKMKAVPQKAYTMLVTAYIENGRLHFFPIEIYDFINPVDLHKFEFPQEAEQALEEAGLAEDIGRHISNVRGVLTKIVQTGLQSEHDLRGIIDESRRFGMNGLAGLITEIADTAENCRHSFTDGSQKVLEAMCRLNRYITAAEERISVLSALSGLDTISFKGEE